MHDRRRARWAPVYLWGLLGPGDRKSIEPLAARTAPADYQQLHHFVSGSGWDPAPLERVLAEKAQQLVGGPDAVLIVDDTALLKQGMHSVGVGRQYAGAAGKRTNCQALVSLTLARGEVPVPVGLRLFLPEEWTRDPARCLAAGVPPDRLAPRTKGDLALEEIDRVRAAGITCGCVVADAGYGASAAWRHALTARELTWAVGIPKTQTVYPADVALALPRAITGRPRTHPVPSHPREASGDVLARARWRRITWRTGTKGPLAARFAAVRVRVADGARVPRTDHLPGEAAWLVGEWRASGERKCYLTNHPANTPLRALATAIKARWACEQAHQQLKEELGLDHFEGRSWAGLHHHALLTQIAFAFLQHLRLRDQPVAPRRRGKNAGTSWRAAAHPDAPEGPPTHSAQHACRRTALPDVPRTAQVRATSDAVEAAEPC